MALQSDEFKELLTHIGSMMDARNKTLLSTMKRYVQFEIRASEKRIRKDMATRQDIARLEKHIDRLEEKIEREDNQLQSRLTILEGFVLPKRKN